MTLQYAPYVPVEKFIHEFLLLPYDNIAPSLYHTNKGFTA